MNDFTSKIEWKESYTFFLLLCLLFSTTKCQGISPCQPQSSLRQDTFLGFGLAFWPGGTLDVWQGILPCNPDNETSLTTAGVKIAAYNMKASVTTWLNISDADRLDLLQSAPESSKVVSVVAFQGNIVSPPRYYASLDGSITGGIGSASDLLLQFQVDGGGLTRLQWYDNSCSGCESKNCLNGNVCAQVDGEASSAPVIMAGCTGTDKYSSPLTSGDPALDLR